MSLEKYRWKHMKQKQLNHLTRHYPELKITSKRYEPTESGYRPSHDGVQGADYTVLRGTIPATYKGKRYNFSTKILLPLTFPQDAPRVKVAPVEGMEVRPSEYVSEAGKVS